MIETTCEECIFYVSDKSAKSPGFCRRNPPTVNIVREVADPLSIPGAGRSRRTMLSVESMYVRVRPETVACGEFKEGEKVTQQ